MAKVKYKKNERLEYALSTKIKEALQRAAIVLQNEVKNNLSDKQGMPQVQTGTLRRSIQIDNSDINNYKIRIGTNLIYAPIQEFGGIVEAKNKPYLKFKIDGKWITKKTIYIPPRPYFRPAIATAKPLMISEFKNII